MQVPDAATAFSPGSRPSQHALGPDKDRLDQAKLDRLEHGDEGRLIAGVHHGDLQFRNGLGDCHELVVLVVSPLTLPRRFLDCSCKCQDGFPLLLPMGCQEDRRDGGFDA